mgnify:CR=1 FL=1
MTYDTEGAPSATTSPSSAKPLSPATLAHEIGDLILAKEAPYFRCIGRDEWWVPLRYGWDEFMSFNLGRL